MALIDLFLMVDGCEMVPQCVRIGISINLFNLPIGHSFFSSFKNYHVSHFLVGLFSFLNALIVLYELLYIHGTNFLVFSGL